MNICPEPSLINDPVLTPQVQHNKWEKRDVRDTKARGEREGLDDAEVGRGFLLPRSGFCLFLEEEWVGARRGEKGV